MKVAVVGSGYVGLVTAACLADSGNHVVAVDNDPRKLELLRRGESPIFEPGLSELLDANLKAARLEFTDDLAAAVAGSRAVFIAVGTPPGPDGMADLTAVESVAEAIGKAITGETVVVNKSTVPVGAGDRVEALVGRHAKHRFWVVSNPEFLKEGTAVDDFTRPDRVVVGANEQEPADVLVELHEPFVRNNHPVLVLSRRAAELAKYAANAYLSTRISFINEIATICEQFGVDVNEVRRAIGADARIGHHFMYPGLGYGGSCFPKDVEALAASAGSVGIDCWILKAVHQRNLAQQQRMVERMLGRLGPDLSGQRIAVWGLAFKPKTDDIREAPAIRIIDALLGHGADIRAYDPQAMPNARVRFGGRIGFAEDPYGALAGAAALLICTEWNEFRSPDFDAMRKTLVNALVFDGRNLFDNDRMRRHGFEYHSVGRPSVGVAVPAGSAD